MITSIEQAEKFLTKLTLNYTNPSLYDGEVIAEMTDERKISASNEIILKQPTLIKLLEE